MPLIEHKSHCPEFAKLDFAEQNFYWTLRTHLDVTGRQSAEPRILLSTLFPLKPNLRVTDISRWLAACQKAGVLRCYRDSKSRPIVEVPEAFQKKLRHLTSKFEPFDGGQSAFALDEPPPPPPKLREEKRREENKNARANGDAKQERQSPPHPGPGGFPSPPRGGEGDTKPAPLASEPIKPLEALRARLNVVYKREPNDRWSDAEEHALLDVSRRANWLAELEHILAYRRMVVMREEIRYFPNTIYSLLSKWTETLDKARVQAPAVKAESRKRKAENSHKPVAGPTAEDLKGSIEYLQREMPNSPTLPDLLARYKGMTGIDLSKGAKP